MCITAFIYKEEVYKNKDEGLKVDNYSIWNECGFFRIQIPNLFYQQNAHYEIEEALISNDGKSIVLKCDENPMSQHQDEVLFIYDQNGKKIAGFTPVDFYGQPDNLRHDFKLSIDNENNKLQVIFGNNKKKKFDLCNGKSEDEK